MTEINEKIKPTTYIENGKYLFNLITIIPHSVNNIEKFGITIYKKTLEINTLSTGSIDLILSYKSNFVESCANIGFVNLHGFLAFLYASNEDIEEKEKSMIGNNQFSFRINKIYNIHCFIITFSIPPQLKKTLKSEFEKIGRFLVGEELFFCPNPYRFDLDISNLFHVFQSQNFKYKLYESFEYNEKFSPKVYHKFLTHIVKGFFKHISYNTSSNQKDSLSIAIRFKIYENNNYLVEIEMFIASSLTKKYFQNLFYLYFKHPGSGISKLKEILTKWENTINNVTFYDKNKANNSSDKGLIINLYDSNEYEYELEEQINNLKNIDIFNIRRSKEKDMEKRLNENMHYLHNVGYNYKVNNIDYSTQNKLLIIVGNNFEVLFSFAKIVAFAIYSKFLTDIGSPNNVVLNRKDELFKNFKYFEKKIQKFEKNERVKIEVVQDMNILKNNLNSEYSDEHSNQRESLDNNKLKMRSSEGKVENDPLKNRDGKINEIKKNQNDDIENDIKFLNENIKEEKNEDDKFKELLYENVNENLEQNINENENNENNSNNKLKKNIENDENLNINETKNLTAKNNAITIFIGTFNVNALESELIKRTNLEEFLFPPKIKEYFNPEHIPTFYCIGLEEAVELNPKNVLIKPKNKKNKAELWEERISEELQQKFNYFLLYKVQLVGILLLVYVKSADIKHINDIHVDILKSGFIGLGNKGCCFLEFDYKNLKYGFCSCHLPAGQKDKNYKDRKDVLKNLLDFKVNKSDYEFYKNDSFFIFGDLNFRSQKVGLLDLQNHIKICQMENKLTNNKDMKKKNSLRHSLEIEQKKKAHKKLEKLHTVNFFETNYNKLPNDINIDLHNLEKSKHGKDKEILDNYFTNENNKKDNEKKIKMDEETFIKFFFQEFRENEELTNLKENELFIYNVDEALIKFPPTYKYIKGTDFYNLSKRVPSWTDRILFKQGNRINPIFYDRICINFSDHKPIVGLFEINIGV